MRKRSALVSSECVRFFLVCSQLAMEEETPSYTSVISHYGLQASDMQVKCSDEAIQIVAEKMTDWRLDRFSLGKAKVDEIDRDGKTACLK